MPGGNPTPKGLRGPCRWVNVGVCLRKQSALKFPLGVTLSTFTELCDSEQVIVLSMLQPSHLNSERAEMVSSSSGFWEECEAHLGASAGTSLAIEKCYQYCLLLTGLLRGYKKATFAHRIMAPDLRLGSTIFSEPCCSHSLNSPAEESHGNLTERLNWWLQMEKACNKVIKWPRALGHHTNFCLITC